MFTPCFGTRPCYFLAIDFDKENWQEDTSAYLEACRQRDLPAALERSRLGNGGHIWLFFEDGARRRGW